MKRILQIKFLLFLFPFFLISSSCKKSRVDQEYYRYLNNPGLPPAYGGEFITASIGDASVLLPPLATDSASFDIISLVYDSLLRYDKNLNFAGELADRWEVSPDGKIITFYLHKGVRWHDGTPFTADDVVFTYKLMIDPETPTPYTSQFNVIDRVEKVSDYEVKVYYKEPYAPALNSWAGLYIVPKHLLYGEKMTDPNLPLKRHPIGTGPYKFVRWLPGDRIELEVNPDYFRGKPYISKYVYRIIPDQATIFLELKAGGLDEAGLTPVQYVRQSNFPKFKRNFNKYKYLGFGYTYLGYNLLNPFFRDKRVRQAISYAINKKEIIQAVLMGQGMVATGPYRPGMWYYDSNVRKYPYDPKLALKLLHEAGWRDTDGDGILDKNGKPFEFTIMTNQGNNQRKLTAEIIQRRLRQIGVKVKIRIIEWSAFINEFIDKKKFDAVLLGWGLDPDPDQYDIWCSKKTGPNEFNFVSYKNPEVDKILDEARHTFDVKKRKELYYKFQEILAEDQPYTFLYIPYSLVAVHKRVRGIKPAPAGISYNFIKWFIPEPLEEKRLVQ